MKLLKFSLSLLFFLSMLGCDSTTNNESDNSNIIIQGTQVVDNNGTLTSNNDVKIVEINAKGGYSYVLELVQAEDSWSDYQIGYKIVTPKNDTISNVNSFKAESAGIYKVLIYAEFINDSYAGDINYNLMVTEHEPLADNLSGKWILVEEKYTYRNYSDSYFYSVNNADHIFEIKNDSLIYYSYNVSEPDSINSSSDLAISSWFWELDVSLNGNKLTFSWSNSFISGTIIYEKYAGNISDITWEEENSKIDISPYIGKWYLSYEKEIEEEYEGSEGEEWNEENSYNSGEESYIIIEINSDSVKTYYNNGFGNYEVYTESISQVSGFLKDFKIENGKLVYSEVGCEMYDDIWYGGYYVEEYSPYTGELPPSEWTVINLPSLYDSLNTGDVSSGNLTAGDTAWFKVPVTSGNSYTVEITDAEFDTYLSIISDEKVFIDDDDDGGQDLLSMISFNSSYSGFYYIALRGFDESEVGTYTISFSEGYTQSRSKTKTGNKLKDEKGLTHKSIIPNFPK